MPLLTFPLRFGKVIALDLQPAEELVYRCDFLELSVSLPDTVAAVDPPRERSDGAGLLRSLPAASFDVAVLSLVLSYIPDPMHRTQARTR